MPLPSAEIRAASCRPAIVWMLVVAMLAAYVTTALVASLRKGPSFDEEEQLAVGYDIWLRHDFRMETANGDLVKRWATLPYLVSAPAFPPAGDWAWLHARPYVLGYLFFFRIGNRPESLLLQGRCMVAALAAALGLFVFVLSRSLFGDGGGLISLALFASSPHMLAFGAMVSTEITICLTLLASTWCVWRLLHRVTWGRLAGSCAAFGLLLLAKPSALVIFPITGVLLAVRFAANRPLEWALGRHRLILRRRAQALAFAALIGAHALAGWAAIWAQYDFRFAASPAPDNPAVALPLHAHPDPIGIGTFSFLRWTRANRILPQGYVRGIRWLLEEDDWRLSFMDGRWKYGGFRSFFPYAIAVKSSPVLFLMLAGGLFGWLGRCRSATATLPAFYEAVPFVTLIAVFIAAAISQNVDIGHRHVLPIYPACYVLAGSAVWGWSLPRLRAATLAGALLLWHATESIRLYPDFLAYFSPFVGGPAQGYRHLVDSSLDWGMDLPSLKAWLERHNTGDRVPVYLAYFGTDSPGYREIECHRLPGYVGSGEQPRYAYEPGIYAISATLLDRVYSYPPGPWTSLLEADYQKLLRPRLRRLSRERYGRFDHLRFARLCAWLRHGRPPDADAGHSILIWRLSEADLKAALSGPPPELETPLRNPWDALISP